MTDDMKEAGVVNSRRMLWRVFGLALLCGIVIPWFVFGILGVIFYVGGLFNSRVVFGASPVLLVSVFAVGILLPRRLILRILRHCGLDTRRMRRGVSVAMIVSAVAAFCGLASMGLMVNPLSLFARGLSRYAEHRADIGAVQDWLTTVDPNDCQDHRLGDKIASAVDPGCPPWCIPVPPSLANLTGYSIILSKDDRSRPMVRIFLGGGGLIGDWGVTVGLRDMLAPVSDDSDLDESRFPMARGAYVWFRE